MGNNGGGDIFSMMAGNNNHNHNNVNHMNNNNNVMRGNMPAQGPNMYNRFGSNGSILSDGSESKPTANDVKSLMSNAYKNPNAVNQYARQNDPFAGLGR